MTTITLNIFLFALLAALGFAIVAPILATTWLFCRLSKNGFQPRGH